jgi:hypothetical protein
VHGVDEAGVEKLPDGGGPAAEPDVLALRRAARPIEDRRRIGVDEVERGVAKGEPGPSGSPWPADRWTLGHGPLVRSG